MGGKKKEKKKIQTGRVPGAVPPEGSSSRLLHQQRPLAAAETSGSSRNLRSRQPTKKKNEICGGLPLCPAFASLAQGGGQQPGLRQTACFWAQPSYYQRYNDECQAEVVERYEEECAKIKKLPESDGGKGEFKDWINHRTNVQDPTVPAVPYYVYPIQQQKCNPTVSEDQISKRTPESENLSTTGVVFEMGQLCEPDTAPLELHRVETLIGLRPLELWTKDQIILLARSGLLGHAPARVAEQTFKVTAMTGAVLSIIAKDALAILLPLGAAEDDESFSIDKCTKEFAREIVLQRDKLIKDQAAQGFEHVMARRVDSSNLTGITSWPIEVVGDWAAQHLLQASCDDPLPTPLQDIVRSVLRQFECNGQVNAVATPTYIYMYL